MLEVQPGGDGEDAEDLRHRPRTAPAPVDAAHVEVWRLERLRRGDRDGPPPAA